MNFHSIDAARSAAAAACTPLRSAGALPCAIAAVIVPKSFKPSGLTLSLDATAAFDKTFRRAPSPKAFAISRSTGAFGAGADEVGTAGFLQGFAGDAVAFGCHCAAFRLGAQAGVLDGQRRLIAGGHAGQVDRPAATMASVPVEEFRAGDRKRTTPRTPLSLVSPVTHRVPRSQDDFQRDRANQVGLPPEVVSGHGTFPNATDAAVTGMAMAWSVIRRSGLVGFRSLSC